MSDKSNNGKESTLIYHGSLFLAVLIWSTTFVNIKIVINEVPPNTLAFLRFLVASIVLVVFFMIRHQPRIPQKDWLQVIIGGLAGVTLYNILQNQGLRYAGATEAAILTSISPVFMVLFAWALLKERPKVRQLVGIGAAFVGSVLVSTNGHIGDLALDFLRLYGDALMLLTAVAWAGYSISIKPLLEKYPPVSVLTYCTVAGTLFLVPVFLLDNPANLKEISFIGWLNVFYLGILASAFAYLLWNTALKKVAVTTAAAYIYLLPVLSAFFAALVLHETITVYIVIGGLVVLAGTYFASE